MNEKGQALVETLLLGLLLLVPLIWALMVLSDLHGAALAATSAVRDAGVSAAASSTASAATDEMDQAIRTAFRDHGLTDHEAGVRWAFVPRFERGARVEITVRYPVRVFRAPFLDLAIGPSIWVDARHVARLHPFVSRP